MSDTPEMHHPVRVDELSSKGLVIKLRPTAPELQAIGERLGVVRINRFEADLKLQPEIGRQISLRGPIRAEIVQNCVITGEPLTQTLEFETDRFFAEDADPLQGLTHDDDESLTDPEIDEPEPILDGKIDVAEQAIEELALNIPPYPRAPDAVFEDIHADPAPDEARPNPFAALAALKDQINSKD
ncbi:DUF177 domain-containing protein [Thalassospiraceae bacterium LMO-JJ14]|nr:DUF177 domain-containing protein [Thalassospiraceae bacterium LMO-JJ14]